MNPKISETVVAGLEKSARQCMAIMADSIHTRGLALDDARWRLDDIPKRHIRGMLQPTDTQVYLRDEIAALSAAQKIDEARLKALIAEMASIPTRFAAELKDAQCAEQQGTDEQSRRSQ